MVAAVFVQASLTIALTVVAADPVAAPSQADPPQLSAGQDRVPQERKPVEAMERAAGNGLVWTLWYESKMPEYKPKSPTELVTAMKAWATQEPPAGEVPMGLFDRAMARAHLVEVEKILLTLPTVVGDTRLSIFGPGDSDTLTWTTLEGSPCPVLGGVAVDTVFNTLRLDSKQRAERIATSVGIQALQSMTAALKDSKLSCLGVGVSFASKSFAKINRYLEDSPHEEFVGLLVKKADILQFTDGELAEEELLRRALIYSKDREMIGTVKKILLGVRP